MPTLASELRNKLERVVVEARDAAEAGALAALEALAVHHYEPYQHMKPAQRELRNHLRARARQLGDRQDQSGRLTIDHLAVECAYEHWRRMLFARFLAENNLLIEPQENMAISLAEAEELAKEDGVDVWVFASRCAEGMLPQIFRPEDPLLQVSFATEHMLKLEKLLASLPQAVFTASDALGWVYQFWQSKKKDEINRSEVKIGADEISAVTQLFTEPYMVEFLLHNTLGAWWAGKRLTAEDAENAKDEEQLRQKVALPGVTWDYLRFVRGEDGKDGPWRPAAGTFDGWRKTAAELKVLDPCCGSGHFLVAALHHLVPIRMAEEGLSAAGAVDAVLRDNLHGLEIDERCCQIAAFALAFEAWKMAAHRELPELHIACSGIGPQCSAEQWLKLAEQSGIPMPVVGREAIRNGLLNLHGLFSQAPTLGSLINPAELPADLIAADYETIQPYLKAVLRAEQADDEIRERAVAAAGMVKTADILAGEYSLVVTNVPYLGRSKQDEALRDHIDVHYKTASADLATALVLRCLEFSAKAGSTALVTPQNWLFLVTYRRLRQNLLNQREWNIVARLGPKGFRTPMWDFNVQLGIISARVPPDAHLMAGIDVSTARQPDEKAALLHGNEQANIALVPQSEQLKNPSAIHVLEASSTEERLSTHAECYLGICTGDFQRFGRSFWEVPSGSAGWEFQRTTVDRTVHWGGMENALLWEGGHGRLFEFVETRLGGGNSGTWLRGSAAWGRRGIAIKQMADLPVSIYDGELYDNNVAVLVPKDPDNLLPIWTFCSSPEFSGQVRRFNQALAVDTQYFLACPFELAHWEGIAAERYPEGLPEPESNDPTQWLFHGHPEESSAPLQVALARLLGYHWPAELDDTMRLSERARASVNRCQGLAKFADADGIVCIPSVRGEELAAERLLTLLDACGIKPAKVRELVGGADLDNWLRNGFFAEHCQLFHNRPFVWHIWDGWQRDGFHALVNYHKLAEGNGTGRKILESLTYSYLGDWITRQKDEVKRGEGGAEDRLAAALELQKRLEAILEGEPPFDIFVRWKPLSEQPIGWEPDINDGVRLNIRPFLASDLPNGRKGAGILRCKPNIKWNKDRGKEPTRPKTESPWFWNWDEKTEDFMGGKEFDGNRWNDCHYTNKTKQAARDAAEEAKRG